MTEAGPYATRAEAPDALPSYEVVLRDFLESMETIGLEVRVFEVEVGDALPPNPAGKAIVARTPYLEVPVAGGFTGMDRAMWVYGLVLYLVEDRLAYLEEELFHTLQVDAEEDYILEPKARAWLRIVSIESAPSDLQTR